MLPDLHFSFDPQLASQTWQDMLSLGDPLMRRCAPFFSRRGEAPETWRGPRDVARPWRRSPSRSWTSLLHKQMLFLSCSHWLQTMLLYWVTHTISGCWLDWLFGWSRPSFILVVSSCWFNMFQPLVLLVWVLCMCGIGATLGGSLKIFKEQNPRVSRRTCSTSCSSRRLPVLVDCSSGPHLEVSAISTGIDDLLWSGWFQASTDRHIYS